MNTLDNTIENIIVEKLINGIIQEKFLSQAQRRYFWWKANKSKKWRKMAKEFEKETPKGSKLPKRVKIRKKRNLKKHNKK
jgi:hypothetical protein